MEKEKTKFNAERAIRESLTVGTGVLGTLVKRFYPEKAVKALSRETKGRLRKRIRK